MFRQVSWSPFCVGLLNFVSRSIQFGFSQSQCPSMAAVLGDVSLTVASLAWFSWGLFGCWAWRLFADSGAFGVDQLGAVLNLTLSMSTF